MLARVIDRTRRATKVDEVVLATTDQSADDRVVNEGKRKGVPVFRGSEFDVLDRYYQAAKVFEADAVVRITADCPLIDPEIIDQVAEAFIRERPDLAGNNLVWTYPKGLDVHVVSMSALTRAWEEAPRDYHRVHVTPYIFENKDRFRLVSVQGERDYSHHRWTVDTPEDLSFVRAVYKELGNRGEVSWVEVLDLLMRKPELIELNRHIQEKALEAG